MQGLFRHYGDEARIETALANSGLDAETLGPIADGIGDAGRLDTLIADLGSADMIRLSGEFGGTRLGQLATELDGATLQRLSADVGATRLDGLAPIMAPDEIARVFRAGGADAIGEVEHMQALQTSGRVIGLEDWIGFTAGKADADLTRALGELREARRLSTLHPGSVVNIGGDARAPTRANGTPMQSFDLTVENATGGVERSVEVTTIDAPVSRHTDFTPGVRHAADKVVTRRTEGQPIPGPHEVTIQMSLDVRTRTRRGTVTEVFADGNVEIRRPDGTVVRSSNIYDDFTAQLGRIPRAVELDVVTLVDATGAAVAVYTKTGGVWARTL
jgi:hypothetical protein